MPVVPLGTPRSEYGLFRVDDRLLHGQVVLGWGGSVRPTHYLLVDDQLALDPQARSLFEQSAPEGCSVHVRTVNQLLACPANQPDPTDTILIVRGIREAAQLARSGVPGPINLGGLHMHRGAREVLPYLFLTPEEEQLIGDLAREGHDLYAQDLPQNPRVAVSEWLSGGAGG